MKKRVTGHTADVNDDRAEESRKKDLTHGKPLLYNISTCKRYMFCR